MAKQHRLTPNRSPKPNRLANSKRRSSPRRATTSRPVEAELALARSSQKAVAPAGPPPRKPAYYEAIGVYESGVRALQRRDFAGAAEHFRTVLQRFPDERELLERARLYLRVCERETANRPDGPRTPQEKIYAATVSLNAGDAPHAVDLLRQALSDDPRNDHGHYILSVALSELAQYGSAVAALRQAILLNSDNRSVALQDPDLATLRETDACRELFDSPVPVARRRPPARPKR